ncbi:MAG: hypothetical protein J5857_00630 [Treponema sp.]|nr:hypothetical protein [Treponema sp.]
MKRFLSLILLLAVGLPLFSAPLYIEDNTYDEEKYIGEVLKLISESAQKAGIEPVDYDTLDLVPYSYSWGQYKKLEPESERLIKEKEKIESTRKQLSGFSNVTIYGSSGKIDDDYIADLDKRIEEAKEREKKQIDPTICYPRVTFKLLTEESYRGTTSIQFEMNYFLDSENSKDFRGEFDSGYLDTRKKKAELCAKFIEAFYPYISGKTQKQEYSAPEIIDQRTVTEPDGSKNQASINVAVRDDYSFIVRTKSSIADYSPTWDLKENLTKKITGNTNYSTFWVPYSPDGKSILFANQSSPTVIGVNENNAITSRVQYKFPSSSYASLSFLSSGDPFIVDQANFKIYFPQKNGEKLPYMTFPVSIITAIASGPDNTICFHVDNSVLFFNTKTYSLEKVVMLEDEESGISLLKILKDGSFITVNRNECYISRFSDTGKLMWNFPFSDSLKYSIYAGGGNGMYFFYDTISNVCWRIAESNADLPPVLAALKNSNGNIHEASLKETADIYKKNAYTLYEAGSYSAALENFTRYLEISPADTDAADKKLLCEVALNKKLAADKTNEALDLYDEYGAETARSAYQEAMKLLEKLRKQVPWDEDVQEAYADLKYAFNPEEGFTSADVPSISVEAFDLSVLFPVLMNVYATNPAGFITVKNNGSAPLKNISVSSYVRKYMDFPSKGEAIASLNPGEQAEIEIRTVLNSKSLQVTENTVLQMQFTVSWEEDGKTKNISITRPVTLYKKSAMSWADTAMLSCFIQPNDPTVSSFVFSSLSKDNPDILSTNVSKAISLSNAIGSIPLTYVSDPETPLSQMIDNEYSVDTVRFPADTLSLKGGDCDDMTTLFCSILESAGIPTALITTPGHIFSAFDTGLKENTAWKNLEAGYRTISINGNVWIPVETTILSEGFEKAWKSASKEISENEFECTLIHEAWEVYATATNQQGKQDVKIQDAKFISMNKNSASSIKALIKQALQKTSGTKPAEQNALARLWYSIGEKEKAAQVLSSITEKSPQYKPAYSNLAQVYSELGREDEATRVKERARKITGSEISTRKTDDTSRAADSAGTMWEE